jgi:prepilin-type processing-associated H-X9-DG protein
MKQLCMAAQLYAKDWGKLPPAEGWVDALEPYLKNKALLHCPAAAAQPAVSYAFNRALAEMPLVQLEKPARTILFYETASADPSPSGTGEDLPKPGRHGGRCVIGFADGHVEVVAEVDPAWWGK